MAQQNTQNNFKQATVNQINTVLRAYEETMDVLLEAVLDRLSIDPFKLTRIERQMQHELRIAAKRAFDVSVALAALIALAPLLAVLYVLVRTKLGAPVIFRQERPGLHGQPFMLYKFRTMTDARGPNGKLLPDAKRLTRFGQLLRKTSLDELPELINVLRGDMSLVGTRPLLMEYLNLYTPSQARRHDVKPGITGWAQVNGRNNVTWEERFMLDVWYVENQTLWLDIKILFQTVKQVVKRDGISQEGHATMPRFTGTTPTRSYDASPLESAAR
jgi:sugar transferase EpsL